MRPALAIGCKSPCHSKLILHPLRNRADSVDRTLSDYMGVERTDTKSNKWVA